MTEELRNAPRRDAPSSELLARMWIDKLAEWQEQVEQRGMVYIQIDRKEAAELADLLADLSAPLETGAPSAAPAATPNEAVPKSELERLMSEKMEWAAERDRKDATIADLRGKLEQAQKDAESKQAKIDALMLEFCPDEMPAEQTANWAAHQVPASPEENAAIDAALKEASNG